MTQCGDDLLGFRCLGNVPVVQLVKHPWVHGRQLLHGEVDVVEAALEPVKQKPGHARRYGRGVAGLGQLGEVQPLAAQTLLSAEVDVVGERAQSADDVHVRHAEGAGVIVLLSNAEQGSELRADAGFLKHFTYSSGTWEILHYTYVLIHHINWEIEDLMLLV